MAAESRHEAALRRAVTEASLVALDAARAVAHLGNNLAADAALSAEDRGHTRAAGPVEALRNATMSLHAAWQEYLAEREQREERERNA